MAELECRNDRPGKRVRSSKEDENGTWEEPRCMAGICGLSQVFYVGCCVSAEESRPTLRNALGLDVRKSILFSKRRKELS